DQTQRFILTQYGRISGSQLGQSFADVCQEGLVAHHVEAFLQRLQILHTDNNGGGVTVFSDHHPGVLTFQPVHDLREPVLHLRQRHLLTNRHSHKYSYFRRMISPWYAIPGGSARRRCVRSGILTSARITALCPPALSAGWSSKMRRNGR